MKDYRIINQLRITAITVILFCLAINCFAQPIDPLSLHFIKDYQVRNFYNSSVVLSKLDLAQDVLDESIYPKTHLTSPGCDFKQQGGVLHISNSTTSGQRSYINLGKLYNYIAIDMDVLGQTHKSGNARVQLAFYINEENNIVISQGDVDSENKKISLEIFKKGVLVFNRILSEEGIAAPNTLRVHLTGKFLNLLLIKNEEWKVLGSFDVSEHFELRDKTILESFSLMAGAQLVSGEKISISKVEQYLTTGTAQADPKVLHYEDGEPIIEGNKIWVAMTTRAYDTQLYQGIYSYNLETKEWLITGTLVFNKGDGLIRQWAASDVFYDRNSKTWKIFTVSHRDDHMLYSGETKEDPRFGLNEITCTKVKYASVGNEEDPSVIWDSEAGKWRMAICKAKKGYQTVLMEADMWDGEWSEIEVYAPTSSTGVLIQKIGGKRYVFIGRGDTPCPLEVLSYPGMEKVGELNLSEHPVGKNIWPAIIPVTKESDTAYYLLTFDRDAWTGPRTYGNIHWYYAEEFAKGFLEYE
ncbi:MAG: hypothetical protein KAS71_03130 [Bacteroidales bacterium]|nr:hypothetical protein [Bacteroidales bacterium]